MGFDDDFSEQCYHCGAVAAMATWRARQYQCSECRQVNLELRQDDEDNPRYTVAYDDADLLDEPDNDEWEDV